MGLRVCESRVKESMSRESRVIGSIGSRVYGSRVESPGLSAGCLGLSDKLESWKTEKPEARKPGSWEATWLGGFG